MSNERDEPNSNPGNPSRRPIGTFRHRSMTADEMLAAIVLAARDRLRAGHNDTCGKALVDGFACTCGHDKLGEALERWDDV